MRSLSVYIHWPFCLSKCPYCDFNSRPIREGMDQDVWAEAYVQDVVAYAKRLAGRKVTSIYFGGGTPSLMKPQTVEAVLNAIAKQWAVSKACEITLEVNPSSADKEKLEEFHSAGVNRISMGVQSFDDVALKFLGRVHSADEARQALDIIASRYDRFSFDLIYARAGQTLKQWEAEMKEALSFAPRHLSLYQLTIEPQTPFYKRARNEQLDAEESLAIDMYERTQSVLSTAGLPAYEVSNHAVVGEESRHNLAYWQYDDYIGIGPGAHGRFVDGERRLATEADSVPKIWLAQTPMRCVQKELSLQEAKQEALMMGLRLVRGLDKEMWHNKFGTVFDADVPRDKVQALVQEGLLIDTQDAFCVTAVGLQRLNAVLKYLL